MADVTKWPNVLKMRWLVGSSSDCVRRQLVRFEPSVRTMILKCCWLESQLWRLRSTASVCIKVKSMATKNQSRALSTTVATTRPCFLRQKSVDCYLVATYVQLYICCKLVATPFWHQGRCTMLCFASPKSPNSDADKLSRAQLCKIYV